MAVVTSEMKDFDHYSKSAQQFGPKMCGWSHCVQCSRENHVRMLFSAVNPHPRFDPWTRHNINTQDERMKA